MRHFGLAALSVILATVGTASAAENGTATIAQTGTSGSDFDYTITLHNTGTTPIGTLWYAWIPDPFYDFLKSSPTVTGEPSGWVAPVVNEGGGDGYSIEWYNVSGSAIPVGGSSSAFTFQSPDNFATVTGPSFFYPFDNTGVSFLYSGFPESDAGTQITVLAPEPAGVGLLGAAGALVLGRRRRSV